MASPFPGSPDVQRLIVLVQTLKNRDLSAICVENGLGKSGVKSDLQHRIISLINGAAKRGDNRAFEAIQRSVWKVAYPNSNLPLPPQRSPFNISPSQSTPAAAAAYPANTMPSYGYTNNQNGFGGANGQRSHPSSAQPGLHFKPSPFYEILTQLGDVKTCEIMTQHRHSITVHVKANSYPALNQCLTDKLARVMVFCAAGNGGVQDIAFPYQCEMKVNGGEVKANLRGLKNKPGSTRPVDITDLLRFKPPAYGNNVEFTYALTNKGGAHASQPLSQKFYLALYLCKSHPVPALVGKIRQRNRISKASVIQEMTKKAQDPDIEATSEVLSLKCPLTYMRLEIPVRGMGCKHMQCFDATSYLQLQEQGPQWLCPICNKSALFDNLAVDDYVGDILANTHSSVEQVSIEPDGHWHDQGPPAEEQEPQPEYNDASYIDDDDDALLISDVSFIGGRSTASPYRSGPMLSTPNTGASREGSSMPKPMSSAKRPAVVIDLTLSDDDDGDGPPPKRPKVGPSEVNGFRAMGHLV